jgi:hypothetical protein
LKKKLKKKKEKTFLINQKKKKEERGKITFLRMRREDNACYQLIMRERIEREM